MYTSLLVKNEIVFKNFITIAPISLLIRLWKFLLRKKLAKSHSISIGTSVVEIFLQDVMFCWVVVLGEWGREDPISFWHLLMSIVKFADPTSIFGVAHNTNILFICSIVKTFRLSSKTLSEVMGKWGVCFFVVFLFLFFWFFFFVFFFFCFFTTVRF
jgi:hypothetical protein